MIRNKIPSKTLIKENQCIVGENLFTKIRRMITNKEAIQAESPTIFTEKKDGVLPEYNIRTDRWEIAQNAMDIVNKSLIAKGSTQTIQGEAGEGSEGAPEPNQITE